MKAAIHSIIVFGLSVALSLASSLAQGYDEPVSLHGFLMNTNELNLALTPARRSVESSCAPDRHDCLIASWTQYSGFYFSESTLQGNDPICQLYGYGCMVVNYSERPDKVLLQPISPNKDQRTVTVYPREISLPAIAALTGARRGERIGAFRYENFAEAWKADQDAFRTRLNSLGDRIDLATAREFMRFVAEHPRAAAFLTPAFTESLRSDEAHGVRTDRTILLEHTISMMVYLVLETFDKVADSHSQTYPYIRDELVTRGSLLDVDMLYESLNKIGRWPKLVHLSPDMREQMEPIYRESEDGRYIAMGVYLPEANEIAFDFTEPFFDVVYGVFHELWHVNIYHSKRTNQIKDAVLSLLQTPESQESDAILGETLKHFFGEHELLAIDQSARLFRGTGQLAEQWGPRPESSEGWNTIYLGSDKEMNLFLSRDLRKSVNTNFVPSPLETELAVATILVPGLIEMSIRKHATEHKAEMIDAALREKTALSQNFDAFLKSRTPTFMNQYRKRYLNDVENFDFESVKAEYLQNGQENVHPEVAHLTCHEVDRLTTVLGSQSDYGIPFPFEVDGGWEKCGRQPVKFMCSLPYLRPEKGAK